MSEGKEGMHVHRYVLHTFVNAAPILGLVYVKEFKITSRQGSGWLGAGVRGDLFHCICTRLYSTCVAFSITIETIPPRGPKSTCV